MGKPLRMPVGPWTPDLPDFENPGSINVRNVYPRTTKSYGPWPSPQVISTALDHRCQGSAAYLDNLGNVNMFAGDLAKLYRLTSGGTVTWTDVSKVGGYNTPDAGQWNYAYFNGRAIATNYNDPIQSFSLASSTVFADLAAAAPRARYLAIIKNFLMAGSTFDPVDSEQPQRAWWSGLNDATNWPTPGSVTAAQVQSSFNDLIGDYGFITGLAGNLASADGAVFMEKAVWRVIYAGPPEVFDFFPAAGVLGCNAPNSIVWFNNLAYYLSSNGFQVFDGSSSDPIDLEQFGQTFLADLDQTHLDRVMGTVDPINKLIIWAYPGVGNSNGNPNHLVVYNYALKRGSVLDVECETVTRLLSMGYTLDQLYTVLGYSLDNLPAPLDSRIWTGGLQLLGTFDALHRLNYFTGPNLAPLVDTTEVDSGTGDRIELNAGIRPLVDGGVPSIAIGRRDRLQDPVVFTNAVPINSLGISHVRTSGRYLRARITLPAGSTFSHIQGIDALDPKKGGQR